MKKVLICFCESEVELDVSEQIDLSAQPEIRKEILEGRFMTVRCETCGKLIKPEFPVLIQKVGPGRDVFFVPELDRVAYLRNKLTYTLPEADRVVIGYEELVEKIRLEDAHLDDRIVEMIKYYLYNKAMESAEGEQDIRIFFNSLRDDTLIFHVHGLKEDEVGVLSVPGATVGRMSAQFEVKMKEEPFCRFLSGAYVSLNRLFTEVTE
jgi:hypothetical protein